MKSKTKKLFLSMFAFASLAITACGGGGNSSSSGGSASGDTSSETSSGGSQSSEDSSSQTQVTKLFVSVDDVEAELTYSSGSYSIGPVELEEDQVLKIYTKDASGTPVSILGDVSVETISFTDWFDVGEGQVTVKVSGTYSFEFEVDGEDYNLTVEKAGEVTEYQATLTEGELGDNLLVHVFNFDGGVEDVIPNTYGDTILTFEINATDLTHFIVVRLKPGEETLGEDWVNVERQSDTLALSDSNVNFTWKANADDDYHLWGSTDGTNWGELGKFTLNESVYSATVTLAKDTEFVFHLEQYADDDSGWRNFTDLVGTGVSGNFKAKGGTGTDSNNIIVETAGEYTFTVTNEHKIQVGGAAPTPTPSTDYYVRGTAVGSWDVAEANKLLAPLQETQIGYISNLHLAVGDFVIANSDYSHKWGYYWDHGSGNEKNIIGGAKDNFEAGSGTDNNIACTVDGYYDIYLMTNDFISIEQHVTPVPENTVWGKKGSADWGAIGTVTANAFTLDGLAAGDLFSVHLTGTTWLNYDNLTGTLAANFTERGGTDSPKDIKVVTPGDYTFTIDGSKLIVGDPLPTKSVQFTVSGVPEVATGSSVYLVGTNTGWAATDAFKLEKVSENWVGTFTLDLGNLGYKFVIANNSTKAISSWEKDGTGNEREITIANDTPAQTLTWGTYGPAPVVYTIYFTDYSKNWGTNVYLHSWNSANPTGDTTAWPGSKMTYLGTVASLNGGYTYSLELPTTHDKFIITNDDDGEGGKNDRVTERNVSDYLSSTTTAIGFYYNGDLLTYNPSEIVIA